MYNKLPLARQYFKSFCTWLRKKRWCGYSQWQKADEQQKLDGLKVFFLFYWSSAQSKYFFFSFKNLYFFNILLLNSNREESAEVSGFYDIDELVSLYTFCNCSMSMALNELYERNVCTVIKNWLWYITRHSDIPDCQFQILISLTTVIQPESSHF